MIAVMVAGALGVTGTIVAPALGTVAKPRVHLASPSRTAALRTPIGAFTPAAADPRLAAVFARGGLGNGDFHFTPAETQRGQRAVTVAVRMTNSRVAAAPQRLASVATNVGIAPIAYNLGVAVGWKRFAVAGDLAHVDLGPQPGSRDAADLSLSYRASRRLTGRIKAATDRPIGEVAQLVDLPQSYSVDLGGSYALSRRLDVTAGLRYRSDRERLAHLDDDRRDSQAAYVGTVFRF
ncbi:hypothetical protein [Sphingomonas bacterium]|uniref:hypothetical protein n=1 Tax=Sphingomonas bacterium TaxID=1895847 RepID=UPI0020C7114A|nr:hypothetical protein [Sphingomonas bacterium]